MDAIFYYAIISLLGALFYYGFDTQNEIILFYIICGVVELWVWVRLYTLNRDIDRYNAQKMMEVGFLSDSKLNKNVKQKEYKYVLGVQNHLDSGEVISFYCFGLYQSRWFGVYVATNKRVVFFREKWFGFTLKSFPLKKISHIQLSKSIMGKIIHMSISGTLVKLKWISMGNPQGLVNYVKRNNTIESSYSNAEVGLGSQIKKLDNTLITV